MVEFAILNKPIVFFAYDLDSYLSNERGFYFDFESGVPGPVVSNSNQLIDVIANGEFDESKMSDFSKMQFDAIDGKASKRVVDFLLKYEG